MGCDAGLTVAAAPDLHGCTRRVAGSEMFRIVCLDLIYYNTFNSTYGTTISLPSYR